MENKIIIRTYQARDRDQIIDLVLGIQQGEFQVDIDLNRQQDLLSIESSYQGGFGNFWVAICDEKVVGTIAAIDFGNRQLALRKMFVNAEYRGSKYGTAQKLYETLLLDAIENKISDIYLGTLPKLIAACRFYEKNDFIVVPKLDLPTQFPIMTVDTLFYHLKLT
jgi:N-acetylglutamate synthase-like GNAT family acetyltransferase